MPELEINYLLFTIYCFTVLQSRSGSETMNKTAIRDDMKTSRLPYLMEEGQGRILYFLLKILLARKDDMDFVFFFLPSRVSPMYTDRCQNTVCFVFSFTAHKN